MRAVLLELGGGLASSAHPKGTGQRGPICISEALDDCRVKTARGSGEESREVSGEQ